jgi:hypothetical protein
MAAQSRSLSLPGVAAANTPRVDLHALSHYVRTRVEERPAPVPSGVAAETPVQEGDELVGAVLAESRFPTGFRPLSERASVCRCFP